MCAVVDAVDLVVLIRKVDNTSAARFIRSPRDLCARHAHLLLWIFPPCTQNICRSYPANHKLHHGAEDSAGSSEGWNIKDHARCFLVRDSTILSQSFAPTHTLNHPPTHLPTHPTNPVTPDTHTSTHPPNLLCCFRQCVSPALNAETYGDCLSAFDRNRNFGKVTLT